MYENSEITSYTAFGLKILSELQLPELVPISRDDYNEPDIKFKKADLSTIWSELAEPNSFYYIKENLCMIKVTGLAIYMIEEGKIISYSPIEGSNDNQIRLYLLGTCLGVALMQRKVLPIHGSCIAINGKAYAFVGDSGAGKSTLASAFVNRGFKLLTDDVIALRLTKDNIPFVIPSYPQQKLWQESLDQFGIESNQYKPIFNRVTKFAIPVTDQFFDKPMPLAGIFVLSKVDQNDIEIIPVKKLERFPILYYNTYRNFMISRSGLLDWHFAFSANLVNRIDFHRIIRPSLRFTANKLVDNILNLINNDDKLNDKKQKGEMVI